ncbi:MAG TPA: iron ABC transporter substrate-binding protein [Stellaceae bacterium]|nr:iron ABC transporter substrate-binding protein [Stellaceae bacterium]
MIAVTRRLATCLALLGLVLLSAPLASARTITDSAGRSVTIPDKVARVFAAGPPASVLLYALAPQDMIGWVKAPSDAEKPFLLPAVRDLPELGRLTGRGDTLNLEVLLKAKPDLIIDFGTINATYKSLADRVQSQTGIPYLLIDGSFADTPKALRLLANALGLEKRGEDLARAAEQIFGEVDAVLAKVPAASRPKVYLARGPEGLETGSKGSINTEIIERVGGINVAQGTIRRGGLIDASPEQVLAWAPDTIITLDPRFAKALPGMAAWATVPAVTRHRVYLAPSLPFGFIDAPPSLNRLIGLVWLLHEFYPTQAPGDLKTQVKDFFHLFYQVDLSDADLAQVLSGQVLSGRHLAKQHQ